MYEAPAEHRNAAAAATSAGMPERPVDVAFPANEPDSVWDPVAIQPISSCHVEPRFPGIAFSFLKTQ
jgi:hypothetical protein